MNWQRGFFRVWIVASVCWLIFVGYLAYHSVTIPNRMMDDANAAATASFNACEIDEKSKGALGNPFNCFDGVSDGTEHQAEAPTYTPYIFLALFGPLSILAAWFGTLWVGAGFRRSRQDSS